MNKENVFTIEHLTKLGWWQSGGCMCRGWRDKKKPLELTEDSGVLYMPIDAANKTCSTEELGDVDFFCIDGDDSDEINRLADAQTNTITYHETMKALYGEPNINAIAKEASEAFWKVVAGSMPYITSGDFPPDKSVEWNTLAEEAVRLWIGCNTVSGYNIPREN